MRGFSWVWLPLLLALGSGCSGESTVSSSTTPGRPARTEGGAVALSRDERIAVVTNRAAGVVSIFTLDPPRGAAGMVVGEPFELDTGPGSEPWAAVIGADDDTAYVVLRQSQQVMRIRNLRSAPAEDARVPVGSEPTDIAISPSGKQLWVSNWADGTLNMITTTDFVVRDTVDLNKLLVDTGALGDVSERPALAHPYAIAITNNGDDNDMDEKLYATEFFSQLHNWEGAYEIDNNRMGVVYSHHLTGQPGPTIEIGPVGTVFADGGNNPTSCFPNQLNAATVHGHSLYVTAMCTSPRGPLGPKGFDMMPTAQNFKTLFHPAVFVVNTQTDLESPEQGRLLTEVLAAHYDAGEHATNARMPLIPNDIAFETSDDGRSSAYVSALGASAVFRLDYDDRGQLIDIGSPEARYTDTGTVDGLPVGVAVSRSSDPPFALALNDAMQLLSVIDRTSEKTANVFPTAAKTQHAVDTLRSDANDGRQFFATGLGVWSFKGQAWGSCEACHPGGLSDGVTWYFSRGPRRTLSAANAYEKLNPPELRERRLMLWGANIDEVHDIEGIVRSVTGGSGGVLWQYGRPASNDCRLLYDGTTPIMGAGSVPCQAPRPTTSLRNGLNGSLSEIVDGMLCAVENEECDHSASQDWNAIDAFLRSLRPPRAPTGVDPFLAEAGRQVFRQAKCGACHSGPHWTLSSLFYTPGAEMNGSIPYLNDGVRPALGWLMENIYTVPQTLSALNPASMPNGIATFRRFAPADQTDEAIVAFAHDAAAAGDDQLQCALRDVGTFPDQSLGENNVGIVPPGVFVPLEVRQDMVKLAQGRNGFNIPSLFGLAVGAPYFHAGNARTLEELFDEIFWKHHRAVVPTFLLDTNTRDDAIKELIAFLLSIDESTELESAPTDQDYDFCR